MKTLLLGIFAAASLHAPPFSHSISRVTAAQLPYSWHPGCPVSPARLRRVRLTYWGFDHRAHTGALVANENAVSDLVHVFSRLYAARFPIRRLQPIDAYGGEDERSLAADNTAAFNCRYVVGSGPRRWSVHAYGEAMDVNPVENPSLEAGRDVRGSVLDLLGLLGRSRRLLEELVCGRADRHARELFGRLAVLHGLVRALPEASRTGADRRPSRKHVLGHGVREQKDEDRRDPAQECHDRKAVHEEAPHGATRPGVGGVGGGGAKRLRLQR